jgi:hypothetical protein
MILGSAVSRNLIALSSFNLYEEPKIIEVSEDKFCYDTLLTIDRVIRTAVAQYPRADWPIVSSYLVDAGFSFTDDVSNNIYWHARMWDEHRVSSSESFFVTFPSDSSPEIAGSLCMATTYAGLFTITSGFDRYIENLPISSDSTSSQLLIITAEHEVIYHDDEVWEDVEQTKKIPLGPVLVLKDQFSSTAEFDRARQRLQQSGYEVLSQPTIAEWP